MSFIMLSVIDDKWKDHLYDLDHLKASIGFRGWGQKDPLVEYKKEAYEMFVDLMTDLRKTVSNFSFRAQFGQPQARRAPQRLRYTGPSDAPGAQLAAAAAGRQARTAGGKTPAASGVDEFGISTAASARRAVRPPPSVAGTPASGPDPRQLATNRGEERKRAPLTATKEPGRNDPCPCGSGKKYKKCHGR